ncbi:hypothetical protein [Xanthobacter aminoxidans]|uniref:Uncharacterized protein n=1 Tax=Xanthobacter aminoxidans TaxID=186280 RepID=A0ABW6ZF45_9HYPH
MSPVPVSTAVTLPDARLSQRMFTPKRNVTPSQVRLAEQAMASAYGMGGNEKVSNPHPRLDTLTTNNLDYKEKNMSMATPAGLEPAT